MIDFSLRDVMDNFTGVGSVAPDEVTTATSQVSIGAGAGRGFINPKYALKTAPTVPEEPAAPTAVAPTYNRMLQAESGNRDYDAQGRPITSPKGAMFASQVMPATAAAPGYGIKPAESQTPEEYNRVGREYYQALLKQFGGDEQKAAAAYNAGPGRIQQNLEANQGQLNVAQLPKETQGYLGKIFKGVGNVVEGMIPSAQAGTLPQRAVAPQAAPVAPVAPATRTAINPETGETYQQLVTSTTPATAPVSPEQAAQQPAPEAYTGQGFKIGGKTQEQLQQEQNYQTVLNSNSTEGISKLAFDINTPVDVQRAAFDKLYQTNAFEENMRRAQAVAAKVQENPTPAAINRAMNDKDTGSYFKVLLFQALGWTGKAKQELDKLNPSFDYTSMTVGGTPYMVKVNSNNGLVEGAWSGGQPVDQSTLDIIREQGVTPKQMGAVKEVVKVGDKTIGVFSNGEMVDLATRQRYTGSLAGAEKLTGTGIEHAETGLVDPTTKKGGYSRGYEGNKLVTRDAAGNIVTDPTLISRLIKVGVGGETPEQKAETKRVEAALERLTKDIPNPTEEQKIKALRDRSVPDSRIEQELGLTPGSLASRKTQVATPSPTNVTNSQANTQAANAVQRVQTSPTAAQTDVYGTAPTIREGESKSEFDKRVADWEARRKPLIKNADAYAERQSEVRSKLSDLQRGIDAVAAGSVNLGPTLSPTSPLPGVQQAIGGLFGTEESQNTNLVKSLMTREGLQGIKNAMGPSISNFDVEQWLKSNPIKETSTLPEIKKYLEKLQRTLYETAEYSRKNAEALGYRTEPLPAPGGQGTNEIKIIKREKIQ